MRLTDEELAGRAAMWAATLRDDAAGLRERSRGARVAEKRRAEMLLLARALNRAAKLLDVPAGLARRRPGAKTAATKGASGAGKGRKTRAAGTRPRANKRAKKRRT